MIFIKWLVSNKMQNSKLRSLTKTYFSELHHILKTSWSQLSSDERFYTWWTDLQWWLDTSKKHVEKTCPTSSSCKLPLQNIIKTGERVRGSMVMLFWKMFRIDECKCFMMHNIWAITTWMWRFFPFHSVNSSLQYFHSSTWKPPLWSGSKNISHRSARRPLMESSCHLFGHTKKHRRDSPAAFCILRRSAEHRAVTCQPLLKCLSNQH